MARADTSAFSYYAASAHAAPARPALASGIQTEICIIGGGFTGLSAAITLAERGHKVVILEENRIGWGASGRSGGQILPGWSGDGEFSRQLGARGDAFLRRTKYRGNELIEDRIAKYAIDCDYVRGAATVASNGKQMAALEREFAEENAKGPADHLELVDATALKIHVASDAYCGGLIDRRAAHCHPLNLCLGEARAAESLGVKIFEGTKADAVAAGPEPHVETAGGAVRASAIIIAGNAYHHFDADALRGLMLPAQTFMMATEPLGADRARDILPGDLAICDANWVLDYFRRSADDRILFGGRCTYSNREIADIKGSLLPRLKRVLPQLSDAKAAFAWSGAIGIPLNRVPLIGRAGDNVFYAQGYSGHGINCSHIAGEILADSVEGNFDDLALFESVRHFRIPAANVLGNPMLAIGMSWFRMRDSLGV